MRKQIYSIAVAAAFAIPALASADVEVQTLEQDQVLVSYDLRETNTAEGRAELERSIRRAAERVCGPQDLRTAGTLQELMANRHCLQAAVDRAMRSVDSNSRSIAAVASN